MADEGYIRKMTAKVKERIEDSREDTIRANRQAELIKSEAPKIWMSLKAWLMETVGQINTEVGSTALIYREETISEFVLRYAGPNQIQVTVSFITFIGQIIADAGAFKVSFTPSFRGNTFYYVYETGLNQPITVEGMGQKILDMATT